MLQSIQDYTVLYIVIVLLIPLCIFAWSKAMRASARRNAGRDAVIASLKEYHALRREFACPTPEQMQETEPARLVAGLCAAVQFRLEESDDPDALFAELPEPAQFAYALGYVREDGSEQLSQFFRRNGSPLTDIAQQAVQLLLPADFADVFAALHAIHNGTSPNNVADIPALDTRARQHMQQPAFWQPAQSYFCENIAAFSTADTSKTNLN
ncbi:MAG: hypothetical protein FWB76_07825 [Oscillospiraceae bacterium]|nr:hypothetical protein [Oscillospiraceae bacterium]